MTGRATQRAPGAGRPRVADEPLRPQSFRCTDAQSAKLTALGGAQWMRDQIDAAAWPRGTKPKK